MILTLGEESLELSRVDLRLGLGSVPTLSLGLKDEHDTQLSSSAIHQVERGRLEWQGRGLDVAPFGFEKTPGAAGTAEARVHALLLEESLQSWFEVRPAAPPRINYGIYQNQSEIGGWTFLGNCLGRRFHVPEDAYKERIDRILPVGACLTRPVRQDNLEYIETVIDDLRHHIPELVGWCGMFGSEEPLRLVFFDSQTAIALDESWELLSPRLPSRYAGHAAGTTSRLRQRGMRMRSGSKMALLEALARHGIKQALEGFLEEGSEADLLYLPGPVTLGERLLLCESITYSFSDPEDHLAVALDLSSGFAKSRSAVVPTRLEGLFDAWDSGDDTRTRVFLDPPADGAWQLLDPQDSNLLDPEAGIMARFVTPTAPTGSYAGLYVRHEKDDRVVFDVQPFQTPLIHGSWQILHEVLEAATLSLNTAVLALATSDSGTSLTDAQGIIMEKKQIMNRAESDIFAEAGTITLDQNVVITESSLDVKSATDIANKVQIDGKLEVGGM